MDYEDNMGWVIKEERKEQGLTQSELAELVGVHRNSIYKYESGLISPPIAILEKIASVFEMSVPTLLDKYNLYDEYIPPHFEGDVDKYEAFKKAVDEDAGREAMKKELQINNLTFELFKSYGFKITQYGEDEIEIITPNGSEYNISLDEYIILGERIVNEMKSFAVYTKIKTLEEIIKHREMEL